jgi:hypothetical protein
MSLFTYPHDYRVFGLAGLQVQLPRKMSGAETLSTT